jgi:hypothetical protein
LVRWESLLTGDDSNGSVSLLEVLVPVGEKLAAPAHKNDAYEEILYGIEGVLTWTVDGTPIEVSPGQALPRHCRSTPASTGERRGSPGSQGSNQGQGRRVAASSLYPRNREVSR